MQSRPEPAVWGRKFPMAEMSWQDLADEFFVTCSCSVHLGRAVIGLEAMSRDTLIRRVAIECTLCIAGLSLRSKEDSDVSRYDQLALV